MIFGFSSWFLFSYPFKQLQHIIENRMLFCIHYTECPVVLHLVGSISMNQIQQSINCRTSSEGFKRMQARVNRIHQLWTTVQQCVYTFRAPLEFLQTHVINVIKFQQFTHPQFQRGRTSCSLTPIWSDTTCLTSLLQKAWWQWISAFQQRPKRSIHWVSRSSFFPWAPWSSRSIDFPIDLLPFMDKTAFISGFQAFCAVSWIPL